MDNQEKLVAAVRRVVREEWQVKTASAVTFEEAARRLSCSAKHIGRMVKSGQLAAVLVGSLRRIPVAEIVRITTPKPSPAMAPAVVPTAEQRKALKVSRSRAAEREASRAARLALKRR